MIRKKLKNKNEKNVKIPSTIKDIVVAILFTLIIILVLFLVYYFFGGSKKIDTNLTSFFGAILAFSGLMTKQYLYKETIDYLTKWIQVEKTIDEILAYSIPTDNQIKQIINDLADDKVMIEGYVGYVKRELQFIPVVPILLVFLYGSALIACESSVFRLICLGLMLLLVSYIAKATISSNNLAIERPELEQMNNELNDILTMLRNDKTLKNGIE